MMTADGWTYEGYPARLPIVARDKLRLDRYGCGDEARFVRVFAATWWKLPRYARRAMRAHWRSEHAGRMICLVKDRLGRGRFAPPRVQLLNGWDRPSTWRIRTGIPPAGVPNHPLGAVYAEGFLLRFYAPVVDRLPDPLLEYLIAHELAHVLQHAIGPERMFGCPAGNRHDEGKHDRHQEGKHRSPAPACGVAAAAGGRGCSRWTSTPTFASSAATG